MKKFFFITFTVIFCMPLFPINSMAESKADKYLGEKNMCLETVRIRETRILDDQTILFEMFDGTIYINRLLVPCFGLKISGGFNYSTSLDKLCKQDNVRVVETGSNLGSTCMLGDFIQFKEKGNLNDVEKLMEGGLLKELVAEGAFKEAFPEKK